MQKYFVLFLAVGLLAAGVAFADHGEETGVDAVDPAESVTSADLGVEDAGMLPTSRLYFFKEFGRGIQRFFTFDSVKKAELELRFTNEKAAEAKEVQEIQPNNEQAITKALANYQKSQERLKVRLESLKETSQNPNVDKLLDKVTEKTVEHAKLMEEIALKTKDIASLQELAAKVQEKIGESAVSGAAKDDPAKFAARLEKSLVGSGGGDFKHLRSVALIDRINEKASEGVKKSLEGLREEFSMRLQENIKAALEKETPEEFSRVLSKIPGDSARHSVILREIQSKETGAAADSLKESVDKIRAEVREGEDSAKKAQEQLKHAREKVLELEKKIAESSTAIPDAVQKLVSQAKEHLVASEKALQEQQYGRAFGQATSAEVAARNGLRALEESREKQATEGDRKEALGEEQTKRLKEIIKGIGVACSIKIAPVCGENSVTYENKCLAGSVKIAHEGACVPSSPTSCKTDDDCPANYVCDAIESTSTGCLLGGDPNCVSVTTITKGICKLSLKAGSKCNSDDECETGLICRDAVCTKPIPLPTGEELTRKVGEYVSSFLIQKINPESIEGLWHDIYPIATGGSVPKTARMGDEIGYTCEGVLAKVINIDFPKQEVTFSKLVGPPPFGGCPVCLAGNSLIDTPSGLVPVKDLQIGMSVWTMDKSGQRVSGVVANASKVLVSTTHQMVHLILHDGRELFVSPGHPTADGRIVGDLAPGSFYDGSFVASAKRVSYGEGATYDILPSGDTGFYWANGILMGSTLR